MVRCPGFEPGHPAWQAGVLATRPTAHGAIQPATPFYWFWLSLFPTGFCSSEEWKHLSESRLPQRFFLTPNELNQKLGSRQ